MESRRADIAISINFPDGELLSDYYLPNVKGGGLFLEKADTPPMGAQILLMVRLPGEQKSIPVLTQVVWVMPAKNQEGKPAGVAVKIINNDAIVNKIEKIIGEVRSDYKREIMAF